MTSLIPKSPETIQKLLLINHIDKICDDLLPIIKDYLFYQEITVLQRKNIQKSCNLITDMYKKYTTKIVSEQTENTHGWIVTPVCLYNWSKFCTYNNIWVNDIFVGRVKKVAYNLQATSCATCGNYIYEYSPLFPIHNIPEYARCFCNHIPPIENLIAYDEPDDRVKFENQSPSDPSEYCTCVCSSSTINNDKNSGKREWGTLHPPLANDFYIS